MPSSTSSSERLGSRLEDPPELLPEGRLVVGRWGKTCALAAAICFALLGAWETKWRSAGVRPSISNTVASWAVTRERVSSDTVVLAGTSKMQSAIDPEVLSPLLGGAPVVQLALVDRSPLPVLEDLAADPTFAGIAVVEIAPRIVFDRTGGRDEAALGVLTQAADLRRGPGDWIDAQLGLAVERSLVVRRPDFSIRSIVGSWLSGQAIEVPFITTRVDRFREIEFERIDLDGRRAAQAMIIAGNAEPPDESGMERIVQRTRAAAETIRRRGGEVVLLMLPVTGSAAEVEERLLPRASYWDVLVAGTGLPAIHFADHSSLADIECPDGLHMDARTAAEFTRRLTPLLVAALDRDGPW